MGDFNGGGAASKEVVGEGVGDAVSAAGAEGWACRVKVVDVGAESQGANMCASKKKQAASICCVRDALEVRADFASELNDGEMVELRPALHGWIPGANPEVLSEALIDTLREGGKNTIVKELEGGSQKFVHCRHAMDLVNHGSDAG